MKERLLRILDLTDNNAYSHAARMVSIGKECREGLNEIKAAEDAVVATIRAETAAKHADVDVATKAGATPEVHTPHAKPDAHVGKAGNTVQKSHPAPAGKTPA